MRHGLLKYLVLSFACMLAGCSISKKAPYQYHFGGKVYKASMLRGKIVDTSFVLAADSSIEKTLAWNRKGGQVRQTLLSPKDTAYSSSDEDARTLEGVENVIYGAKKKWKTTYDQFLKKRPGFKGKIVIRILVRPDGIIEDIFILEDTTGYPEFTQAVIDVCSAWSFEKSGGTANDWITFPLTFYE